MKKRWMALLCAAALMMAAVGSALPAAALWVRTPVTMGDVDGDREISTADAVLALQYAAKLIDETGLDVRRADVDGDREVSTADAVLLLQYAAKLIDTFPCGAIFDVARSEAETTPNENPESFADYTSGSPIFTSIFTADPSAHVWEDGRLYVYASHDIFPSRGCDLMDKYHVFSTDNMVDWMDEGEILSAADLTWGRPEGGFMWAPDAAYKDGTYYFYYPHPEESDWGSTWRVGVATSDKPAADFKDQGMMRNPDGTPVGSGTDPATGGAFSGMIDPCVFEDEDGTFYLTVGGGGRCYVARIAPDMMTLETELKPLPELAKFHEGSWLFKKDGIYYLMYADGGEEFNSMRYATATDPMGPYTNRGVILDPVKDCETTHGSIVQYKGNWYLFYHNAAISGNGTLRSVCVDQLFFNEDGSIRKVVQTDGVKAVGAPSDSTEGKGRGLLVGDGDTSAYSVRTDYGPDRCEVAEANFNGDRTVIENMHRAGATITIAGVDGGRGGKALLTVHYANGQQNSSTAQALSSADTSGDGYFLRFDPTSGWGDASGTASCLIDLAAGSDNTITLRGGMGGFNATGFTVSLLPENAA